MKLYVMVGAPGSGKSTAAKLLCSFEKDIVRLNADELRGYYGKDEMDQSVSFQAFQFIKFATEMLFKQGFSVLIDVTSKDKRAREEFVRIAKKYGAETVAVVFQTSLEVCLARNAARERVVPEEVVRRIYSEIVPPLPGEFDEIFLWK